MFGYNTIQDESVAVAVTPDASLTEADLKDIKDKDLEALENELSQAQDVDAFMDSWLDLVDRTREEIL